jgi:hypothetical protein
MLRVFLLLAVLVLSALSALPPGLDEEVFCPDRMCIRKRPKMRQGFTGPRAMFLECFNPSTKETCRPRVWGVKLEQEYKDSLLRDKWHSDKCTEEERKVIEDKLVNDFLLLGTRLDHVLESLALLSLF